MPSLNWIGKEKIITHHTDVPFRVLEHRYGFNSQCPDSTAPCGTRNMIIHGDNLAALNTLHPEYKGRVDCIYIDPPYNTGNEKWRYNDNVNDPHILRWLGEVVGAEGEDFTRHDKWLCMMYPRLVLLRQLFSYEGASLSRLMIMRYRQLVHSRHRLDSLNNKTTSQLFYCDVVLSISVFA